MMKKIMFQGFIILLTAIKSYSFSFDKEVIYYLNKNRMCSFYLNKNDRILLLHLSTIQKNYTNNNLNSENSKPQNPLFLEPLSNLTPSSDKVENNIFKFSLVDLQYIKQLPEGNWADYMVDDDDWAEDYVQNEINACNMGAKLNYNFLSLYIGFSTRKIEGSGWETIETWGIYDSNLGEYEVRAKKEIEYKFSAKPAIGLGCNLYLDIEKEINIESIISIQRIEEIYRIKTHDFIYQWSNTWQYDIAIPSLLDDITTKKNSTRVSLRIGLNIEFSGLYIGAYILPLADYEENKSFNWENKRVGYGFNIGFTFNK